MSVESLIGRLESLLQTKPESLVQKDRLGNDFNFEGQLPILNKIDVLLKEIRSCGLERLSDYTANKIENRLIQIVSIHSLITSFTPGVSDRQSIDDMLHKTYAEFFEMVAPFIAYARSWDEDKQRRTKNELELLEGRKEAALQSALAAAKSAEEADKLLQTARERIEKRLSRNMPSFSTRSRNLIAPCTAYGYLPQQCFSCLQVRGVYTG